MTKLVLTKRFTKGVLEGITIEDTFTARTAAEVEQMFNLVGKRIASCTNADYEVQAVRYAEQPESRS